MTIPVVARGLFEMFREAARRGETAAPYQAPKTILNVPISGARRFAAQSWPIERLRAVGKAGGGTLNDAVLAMCAGALRRYLLEQGALPEEPLIAMIPVSIRPKDAEEHYGNAVSAILCNLATHLDDPLLRLEAIRRSMQVGKNALSGMSREAIVNMGVLMAVPMLIGQLLGLDGRTRPAFNVTISNVPGPKKPLYWNGARMEGIYPVSIVTDGQALNITLTSYVDHLEFGLIGCRKSLPHLQHLLGHLEDSLAELERAAGLPSS
jgi:diacylglycerol O-acyltransferase